MTILVIGFYASSNANPPFWIPIHIVIPERPTECAVFNVNAGTLLIYSAFIRAFCSLDSCLLGCTVTYS